MATFYSVIRSGSYSTVSPGIFGISALAPTNPRKVKLQKKVYDKSI